jgi:hypothetical protein
VESNGIKYDIFDSMHFDHIEIVSCELDYIHYSKVKIDGYVVSFDENKNKVSTPYATILMTHESLERDGYD